MTDSTLAPRGQTIGALQRRFANFLDSLSSSLARREQRECFATYASGILRERGRRPLTRIAQAGLYERLQHFLADSPWREEPVWRALAEQVVPALELEAYVVDDTGFAKKGERSAGVQRQYSGTLGRIGNCQIGVSLHAVGRRGRQPLGFALYLPQQWLKAKRRRQGKIAAGTHFRTKPELALDLLERALAWGLERKPVLADADYGLDLSFRARLSALGLDYVVGVNGRTSLYPAGTRFMTPRRSYRGRKRLQPSVSAQSAKTLLASIPRRRYRLVKLPQGSARFFALRVYARGSFERDCEQQPREEWLVADWRRGEEQPRLYLSNLPPETPLFELARLARLRWTIEHDYRRLKGGLALDHHQGRSHAGFERHALLCACVYGFLTIERLRPESPAQGLTFERALELLRPIFAYWSGCCPTCGARVSPRRRLPSLARGNLPN